MSAHLFVLRGMFWGNKISVQEVGTKMIPSFARLATLNLKKTNGVQEER
jgi:hypothetical protein